MLVRPSQQEREQEEALEWQRLERAEAEAARKRDHEYRLVRMKTTLRERQRVWLTLVRLPVYITAIWGIVLLQVIGRPVPETLVKVLDK